MRRDPLVAPDPARRLWFWWNKRRRWVAWRQTMGSHQSRKDSKWVEISPSMGGGGVKTSVIFHWLWKFPFIFFSFLIASLSDLTAHTTPRQGCASYLDMHENKGGWEGLSSQPATWSYSVRDSLKTGRHVIVVDLLYRPPLPCQHNPVVKLIFYIR